MYSDLYNIYIYVCLNLYVYVCTSLSGVYTQHTCCGWCMCAQHAKDTAQYRVAPLFLRHWD